MFEVASTDAGEPLFPLRLNVRRDLRAACKRAAIPAVSPNARRRTFATWLAEAGVHELVTASLMGHTSSAMVRRVYAAIGSEAQHAAIAKLPSLPVGVPAAATGAPLRVVAGSATTRRTAQPTARSTPRSAVTKTVTGAVPNVPLRGGRDARGGLATEEKNPAERGVLGVPRDRIELPTRGFSIPCSTN